MSGYTKLFSSILASSVWNEPNAVRIAWITLLAMADRTGLVDASVGGIAHQARLSRDETEKALAVLQSPDRDSKNPAHEGRRIAAMDRGGFMVLNYAEYRDGLGDDPETVAARNRQRKWRAKHRDSNVTSRDTGVGVGDGVVSVQGEGDAGKGSSDAVTPFDLFWSAYPRKIGKRKAAEAWARAKGKPPLEIILNAVEAQKSGDHWRRDGGQYVPNPATWLHQGRWDDEVNIAVDPLPAKPRLTAYQEAEARARAACRG